MNLDEFNLKYRYVSDTDKYGRKANILALKGEL